MQQKVSGSIRRRAHALATAPPKAHGGEAAGAVVPLPPAVFPSAGRSSIRIDRRKAGQVSRATPDQRLTQAAGCANRGRLTEIGRGRAGVPGHPAWKAPAFHDRMHDSDRV